ncbi:multiheme c-type cytochrome [Crateriforma conspicua]|uniref:Perchlorate reductase subunit gamma n=1 Tax=Crateriforma conspicua TaxID=2527996 RepID=A0A5C5Y5C8_9PLAN|nr:multiheme c-type cytochrome [Crateriforma conspicua]TWT70129.1 Perchlorate reductase subunit gamma precursor [Crateriforma conspicua]
MFTAPTSTSPSAADTDPKSASDARLIGRFGGLALLVFVIGCGGPETPPPLATEMDANEDLASSEAPMLVDVDPGDHATIHLRQTPRADPDPSSLPGDLDPGGIALGEIASADSGSTVASDFDLSPPDLGLDDAASDSTDLLPPAVSLSAPETEMVISSPSDQLDLDPLDLAAPASEEGPEASVQEGAVTAITPKSSRPAAEISLAAADVPTGKGSGDDESTDNDSQPNALRSTPSPGTPENRLRESADQTLGQPIDYRSWPKPALTLVFTGQQHGYIEPCGCTGLDRQKGGVARRYTFFDQLKSAGWTLAPIDTGNLIRRFSSQGEIKYHRSVEALRAMNYQAVGFGPDDVRLGVSDLIQEAAAESADDALYVSANVVLYDPSLMPSHKIIQQGGVSVGVTTVLDPEFVEGTVATDVTIQPAVESAKKAVAEIENSAPDWVVVTFFGTEEAGQKLAQRVDGIDLLCVSGGYGEPTFQPQAIDGTETRMIVTGDKAMYAGLVALYPDDSLRYARVPLSHEFADAPEMRQLMRAYQEQLRDLGLEGLGINPQPHPDGGRFVGSATCGECHTTAFEIWESTPHVHATDSIVSPPKERGDIARHFDPECISCHVTGWNPQKYYPYDSGYLSLETTDHLTGNGCENCHGPGADHSAAEAGDLDVTQDRLEELRREMQLPLEKAREKCMECHDLDNSPDFHDENAFEDVYWPEVEHYGVD